MSAQDETDQKPSSSYLSKLSPWSRSPRIPPSDGKESKPPPKPPLRQQKGGDHVVSHRHRISLKQYPKDCPALRPCWFHAVDVPKRRPHPAVGYRAEEKPKTTPKKYAAFSVRDSKAIEAAFQTLLEAEDTDAQTRLESKGGDISLQRGSATISDSKPNVNLKNQEGRDRHPKVPVNEDWLFDVDVEARELAPAYWLGPVYDVRRGTWFYQDGSTQRPCDENLAAQLEEGFLKVKAWRLPSAQQAQAQKQQSPSQPRTRPISWTPGQDVNGARKALEAASITPHSSASDLRSRAAEQAAGQASQSNTTEADSDPPQNTYRLFGSHMNSVVTYQDGNTAWLLTDDFMSRMSSTMYQRFAGGGHFAGVKMTRGYINPARKPEAKADKAGDDKASSKDSAEKRSEKGEAEDTGDEQRPSLSETRRANLTRQMSSLLEDTSGEDREKQEEEARRLDQREIEDDYRETEGDEQGRDIEHLILVTHGIGQRLGLRIDSVNFVHDVNTLRKTLKAVYADSPDLRALNAELGNVERVNSRVQVLPICWRHLLDFPKQSLKHNRKEHDLGDTDVDDDEFPSLEDITVEGVPAVRNLITDLALDILLYQSPAYKDHISRIVLSECNRIYQLFMQRNPTFDGKVSMIGHSLGSAIMFDILCRQGQEIHPSKTHRREQHALKLDFEVEDFYALGSPIGLFQMLKGRNIVARIKEDAQRRRATTSMEDPLLDMPPLASARQNSSPLGTMGMTPPSEVPTSSPKCSQVFNIFHPTDPISYRIEPLISPAMATLKPQPLPYTKRGIFGAPMGQGLTGIGARVSQSVSSMWSSMASSLLTRGLGYTGNESTGQLPTSSHASNQISAGGVSGTASTSGKTSTPLSMGAGTNITAGVIPTSPPPHPPISASGQEITTVNEEKQEQIANDALAAGKKGQHPPTLIDAEIETLFAGYQKRRKSVQTDSEATGGLGGAAAMGSTAWREAEERAKKLRREEEKVRRLNRNGRVDYAIQEGVFDINLIAAIASHLSYWSDEDVSHFLLSQLLSGQRVVGGRSRAASAAAAGSAVAGSAPKS
ncbi:hypothetical protein B0A50_02725 [Salinomyces thailandicus]|uniref:DDHD domain-containing protein n=1 Tax=Salinomyces thailandicus TaxID=706561 RepID=A0A4U0U6C2_9PEZI|nr:hypothetical protein B0A50_02725 [Salinomyces thailandica]